MMENPNVDVVSTSIHSSISDTDVTRDTLALRETKALRLLRGIFIVFLTTVAGILAFSVFKNTHESEQGLFEAEYRANSARVIETFHDSLERKLLAFNDFATQITSYAIYANQTFPFVTLPTFALKGAHFRIQAKSADFQWAPLVTDETREEWEAYAMKTRWHNDEAFAMDTLLQNQQDEEFQLPVEVPGNRQLQDESRTMTILNDTTGYHPKIWSNGAIIPPGDEPTGSGPYLPLWQWSPVAKFAIQQLLNMDLVNAKTTHGLLPMVQETEEVIMNKAQVPLPSMIPILEMILSFSQYRYSQEKGLSDPLTYVAYPVFDSFNKTKRKLVGLLTTSISWTRDFSNILPEKSRGEGGIICILSNSYNQTLVYQIDGQRATFIGDDSTMVGNANEHMEIRADINSYVEKRAAPDTRSYLTVPLNKTYGRYSLRIYPADDAGNYLLTTKPAAYAAVVAGAFLLACILFLVFAVLVERRQQIMNTERLRNAKDARKNAEAAAENAKKAAQSEYELNEFLAHEVRNPLTAAIAASDFVLSTLDEIARDGTVPPKSIMLAKDDVRLTLQSLHFVNDFLLTLLDLRDLGAGSIKLNLAPTNLRSEVLEPAMSMLLGHSHDKIFVLECPDDLVVTTDALRMKQVIMNLGRNALKYIRHSEGDFVRFRVEVNDQAELVFIHVEDSGRGVPPNKQQVLFKPFSDTHELLSQRLLSKRSGIGLSICKALLHNMGGDIHFDETYKSGVDGFPGARFVVTLDRKTLAGDGNIISKKDEELKASCPPERDLSPSTCIASKVSSGDMPEIPNIRGLVEPSQPEQALPENKSILLVDDDRCVRRLLARGIARIAPTWVITEATSGEDALEIIDKKANDPFDVIFMDQYMHELLGTATTKAMRDKRVESIICGLSANQLEKEFLEAGANCFVLKPLKVGKNELMAELNRIFHSAGDHCV